jgi:hypothetical protein
MKKVITIIALLAASTLVRANDSAIEGTGGTPSALESLKIAKPIKGEHSALRMVRERVTMTVLQNDYNVVADFEFHNDGATRTVLMGFPEGAGGDFDSDSLKQKTAFKTFFTSVDGRRLKSRRIVAASDQDSEAFQAYWVKSVRFGRNQTRRVRVSYRAPLGGSTDGSFVYYDFTGGNWKGKVAQSDLSIKFTSPGNYLFFPIGLESKPKQWRDGSTLHYRWRNWQAQEGFDLRFMPSLPGTLMQANDEKELNEKWALWQGARTFTLASGNPHFDAYRVPTFRRTDFLLRDGRTFVAVRAFYDNLQYAFTKRQVQDGNTQKPKTWNGTFRWDAKNQSALFTTGGAKAKTIRVGANSRSFNVNSFQYKFPTKTFIGGVGDNQALYAPLDSLVTVLGGKMKVNAKTQRVWFKVPAQTLRFIVPRITLRPTLPILLRWQ